jgi:hypothetical protein
MSDYEVGKGKPPRHTRFQKGNRANPLGRGAKKVFNERDILREILDAPVAYKEGGRTKKAPQFHLLIRSFVEKAVQGDIGSAAMVLKLRLKARDNSDIEPITIWLNEHQLRA